MSLNTASTKDGSLVLQGDRVMIAQDGVEATFEASPPQDHFKGTKKGKIYLTSLVMAFVPKSGLMKTLTVPFGNLKNLEIKQPVFGANYITGNIIAQPGGGWEGRAKFRMVFNSGGAIEFAQALMRAVTRAQNAPRPTTAPNPAPPPQAYPAPYPAPYQGYPGAMPPQPQYGAPPQPAYPNGGYYPPQPAAAPYPQPNAAYPPPGAPVQLPPPYYGDPMQGSAPQQTAYLDPRSQNVYIPQAEPSAPPPPYSEKAKAD